MDFTLIKRAGLTQLEFSKLAKVSRATTNMWSTGKMAPHRYISARIAAVLATISQAINNDKLPLSPRIPKHKRLDALFELMPELK